MEVEVGSKHTTRLRKAFVAEADPAANGRMRVIVCFRAVAGPIPNGCGPTANFVFQMLPAAKHISPHCINSTRFKIAIPFRVKRHPSSRLPETKPRSLICL